MPNNGALLTGNLAAIPGGNLRKDAAAAWNAMHKEIKTKTGIDIRPTGPRSSYRTLYWQKYFWNEYKAGRGNLAAAPGTSNHGWGLAVDVATPAMANAINKYGAPYGYQKKWSDASNEWWHFKFREGVYKPKPVDMTPTIVKGSKGQAVKRLQARLRAIGYLPKSWRLTSNYSYWVRRAVRKFQKDHKRKSNGIVNQDTWDAINYSYNKITGKK
jgi:hypothetical protein